jgi:hypothetical protein
MHFQSNDVLDLLVPSAVDKQQKLIEDMRGWAQEYAVSLRATTAILKILRPHHSNLPRDARTLLRTPRVSIGRVVKPGR